MGARDNGGDAKNLTSPRPTHRTKVPADPSRTQQISQPKLLATSLYSSASAVPSAWPSEALLSSSDALGLSPLSESSDSPSDCGSPSSSRSHSGGSGEAQVHFDNSEATSPKAPKLQVPPFRKKVHPPATLPLPQGQSQGGVRTMASAQTPVCCTPRRSVISSFSERQVGGNKDGLGATEPASCMPCDFAAIAQAVHEEAVIGEDRPSTLPSFAESSSVDLGQGFPRGMAQTCSSQPYPKLTSGQECRPKAIPKAPSLEFPLRRFRWRRGASLSDGSSLSDGAGALSSGSGRAAFDSQHHHHPHPRRVPSPILQPSQLLDDVRHANAPLCARSSSSTTRSVEEPSHTRSRSLQVLNCGLCKSSSVGGSDLNSTNEVGFEANPVAATGGFHSAHGLGYSESGSDSFGHDASATVPMRPSLAECSSTEGGQSEAHCASDWARLSRELDCHRNPSPEPAPRSSPDLPRVPSLGRLRLSSREPETVPLLAYRSPSSPSKLPPPLCTSQAGATLSSPGVPRVCSRGRCSPQGRVRSDGQGSLGLGLKRKRPPMLDVSFKDAFTASPTCTPPPEEAVEDVKESCAEGPGYAVFCQRGRRRMVLEDRFQAVTALDGDPTLSYYGVFDGHGGTAAAEFASSQLHKSLAKHLQGRSIHQSEAALVDAYLETDEMFLAQKRPSGASCVACVVAPSCLVVGHAGDCRAVLGRGRQAVCLTEDHKASRDDERKRIEALGGQVDDFTGTWRVQGIMAVTRGIGDQNLKDYITPLPETRTVELESPEDFVILASDGLWDVVSPGEAVALASDILHPHLHTLPDCHTTPHPPTYPSPLSQNFPHPYSLADGSRSLGLDPGALVLSVQLETLLSPLADKQQKLGSSSHRSSSSGEHSPARPLPKKGFRSSSVSSISSRSSLSKVASTSDESRHQEHQEHQLLEQQQQQQQQQDQLASEHSQQSQQQSRDSPLNCDSSLSVGEPTPHQPESQKDSEHGGSSLGSSPRGEGVRRDGGGVYVGQNCLPSCQAGVAGSLSASQGTIKQRIIKACRKLAELAVKKGSNDDICVMVILPSASRD